MDVDVSRWISLEDGLRLEDSGRALEKALASEEHNHLPASGFYASSTAPEPSLSGSGFRCSSDDSHRWTVSYLAGFNTIQIVKLVEPLVVVPDSLIDLDGESKSGPLQ